MTPCFQTYTPNCAAAPHEWCELAAPDLQCPHDAGVRCEPYVSLLSFCPSDTCEPALETPCT